VVGAVSFHGRRAALKEVMQPETAARSSSCLYLTVGLAGLRALGWWDRHLHSEDSGAHWQWISEFPLFGLGEHSYPSGLQFQDPLVGSVRILSIINLACCRYETVDGGLTWRATGDCRPEKECLIETLNQYTLEEISWKYDVSQLDSAIVISGKSYDEDWTEVSTIPLYYGYEQGKIVLP
jgi:hypothetical protein